MVWGGVALLVLATIVIGYGNSLATMKVALSFAAAGLPSSLAGAAAPQGDLQQPDPVR